MKFFTKIGLTVSALSLPFIVFADASTTSIVSPVHVSPSSGSFFASANNVLFKWSDVVVGSTSASYHFELAKSTTTAGDGSFSFPSFVSSLLATSSKELSTTTPEGLYYWHVRAINPLTLSTSTWSSLGSFILDKTPPTIPFNVVLVSSVAPNASTTNGTQVWSFSTSTDALSGVLSYQYAVDSISTWVDIGLNNSLTTALGVGTHTIYFRATDKAGNISGMTKVYFSVTTSSTTVTSITVDTPKNINQCKKGGWRLFTLPMFKNQGKCVSFVEKAIKETKKNEKEHEKELKKKMEEVKKEPREHENEMHTLKKHQNGQKNDDYGKSSEKKEHKGERE